MPAQVPLKCRCGAFRGVMRNVSPGSGNRVVCYCHDCQAFAHYLGVAGVLDAHGGSDIYQVAPTRISITQGATLLRCMRLSDNGLYRFYTDCCRSPVGNMVGPRFPFIGTIAPIMDHAASGHSRDADIGPSRALLYGEESLDGAIPKMDASANLKLLGRLVRLAASWWFEMRGGESPFFDPRTNLPRAETKVLTLGERNELLARARRGVL